MLSSHQGTQQWEEQCYLGIMSQGFIVETCCTVPGLRPNRRHIMIRKHIKDPNIRLDSEAALIAVETTITNLRAKHQSIIRPDNEEPTSESQTFVTYQRVVMSVEVSV